MLWQYITLGVVVLIIVVFILMYNNLVKSKLKVENAWATIDTQLNRRFDLIPNLLETVKGYAKHEENTLTEIAKVRNQYASANSVEDKVKAVDNSENLFKSLFALAEAYPDLKANQNFLNLQNQLVEMESKIAFSRQFYNDTVQMYNNSVMAFPQNIVASIFGFKSIKFFEIGDTKRENVEVKF